MVRMGLRARTVAVAAACCLTAGVVIGAPGWPAAAAHSTPALYVPAGPVRMLDTRDGTGTGGVIAPVGPNSMIKLQVDGVDGVPASGVTAVVLNVTATDTTADSYVTVWPDGSPQPTASNLNFTAGQTIPNLVTVPVGADGAVDFYNHVGSTDLVADLAGYYTTSGSGSLLDTTGPVRVLDTRDGTGTGGAVAPVGPGQSLILPVDGVDGVPASGVTAVVLNVTATDTTADSYVTAWPDGQPQPTASNLNFTAGETIPNLVVVPVGSDGKVDFFNHVGSTDLVADLSGYYTATGAAYTPVFPVRVLDTRDGTGTGGVIAPVGPGQSLILPVGGVDGVPASGVTAVVLNVTATDTTASSYVTAWPDGQPQPTTSNLNFTAGETIPNLVVVPVGADGKIDFFNHVGSTDLVADLAGYFTPAGTTWGDAIQVPGTASLSSNTAFVQSLSCPSAGNCTAGGNYQDSSGNAQVFVADQKNGTWGTAIEIPGTAALNAGGGAGVLSVSCASVGNCTVGGDYQSSPGNAQAFVADEVNGAWDNAIEVPGTAALNTGAPAAAFVFSVSCPSAGNCTAGGAYTDSSGHTQAFVADEANGVWGNAVEVPGTGGLNSGNASVQSLSCASAGNCAAGGYYSAVEGANGFTQSQAFVADEVNGKWGNAIQVPGTPTLDTGGIASVDSVSCGSAGNCAAGGTYVGSSGTQAFVADEVSGVWGNAIQVPGTAALNTGGFATVNSVSCPSAGDCAAVGAYLDSAKNVHSFVTDEVNGSWDAAIDVLGSVVNPDLVSVSCASAGNCVAGGGSSQAFVVSEADGSWGDAIQVPGTPAFGTFSSSAVYSVSCPPTGACAAGGEFHDLTSAGIEAFVVNQN